MDFMFRKVVPQEFMANERVVFRQILRPTVY